MTSISYACACCGEEITGAPDIAFESPAYYATMPEDERAEGAELSDDFCLIEEDHFIRVVCPIPIRGTDDFFGWGVWVSLSEDNFERYRQTFKDDDQSSLGPMFGWFSNQLPEYPETLNLQTTVIPEDGNQRPQLWINDEHADHPLYIDQREGISAERLGEIYARLVCTNSTE